MREYGNSSYYMDYITIYRMVCCDIQRDVHEMLDGKNNKTGIYFYTLSEEAQKMPFVVIEGGHYSLGDKYFTKRRDLYNYQLIVTLDGCGIVEMGGQSYSCRKGSAILINCREPHYMRTNAGEIWEYEHIHVIVKEDSRIVADKAVGYVEECEGIHTTLDKIMSEILVFNAYSPYLISNYISDIMTDLIMLHLQAKMIPTHIHRMEKSAKYIHEHLQEKISIENLAQKEFLSVFYFSRKFKEYYGVTPYEYILRCRINKAKGLLMQGVPIQEVANLVGFGCSNTFFRNFKKSTGISPSQFVCKQPKDFSE